MSDEIKKSVRIIGRHLLSKVIEKVFPPDPPLAPRDKGSVQALIRHGKQYNLYWGDLHGHSSVSSEAVGTPDDYYHYASAKRKLDFVALTDHDFSIDDEDWQLLQEKANAYNQPGFFTTFIAYEWTSRFGHKVVLFPSTNVPSKIMVRSREKKDNPYALWQFLKPFGAITIPHHTISRQITTDWYYKDNTLQPLVEIYSKHGSCEHYESEPIPFRITREKDRSVQDALRLGHRLGFVGCSDTHCSRPGSAQSMELLTHRIVLKYSSGLTGLFAREKTREGIWDALSNRRTYATTGTRMFVDFRVGDHFMGEEFQATKRQRIAAYIDAPAPIQKVEIIKDGQVIHGDEPSKTSNRISLLDPQKELGTHYFYVRVTLGNGERAWASPVWVHYR